MSLEQDLVAAIAHHLEIQSIETTTTTFSILHRYPQIHLQGERERKIERYIEREYLVVAPLCPEVVTI